MTFNTLLIHGIVWKMPTLARRSAILCSLFFHLLAPLGLFWFTKSHRKKQFRLVGCQRFCGGISTEKKTEKKYELISFKEQNVSWRTPGKQFLVKAYKSKVKQSYLLKKDATRGISGVVQLLVAIVAGRVRRRFTSGSCTIKIVLNGNHLNGFGVCSPPKGFSTEVVFLVKK